MLQRRVYIFMLILLLSTLAMPVIHAQEDDNTLPPWDGETRFTVLVMGMDRRPGARDNLRARTDAILLVSVDPATESIGVLHIPRDLHFVPPDLADFLRINTLLVEGENLQEGYGPYYMMETLQYNLGIYIDRYVAFDFEAFVSLVDAIGGVTVNNRYIIDDPTYPDMNYGYDPFYLPSGPQTLDGYDALRFARTRHSDNDYLRGERQMQIVVAVMERLREPEALAQLIRNGPDLLEDLQHNVYTDMTLEEMTELARFALSVDQANIHTGAINQAYIISFTIDNGQSAHIPDRTKMVELLIDVFGEDYTP